MLNDAKNSDKIKNLYDHIIDVMDFLVVNYPDDALIKFEEVSYLIKHGDHDKLHKFLRSSVRKYNAQHDSSLAKSMQPYFDKISKFYSVSKSVLEYFCSKTSKFRLKVMRAPELVAVGLSVSFRILSQITKIFINGLELTLEIFRVC